MCRTSWSSMMIQWESFCTRLWLACRWRPYSFLARVCAELGARWSHFRSVAKLEFRMFWWLGTLVHFQVGLSRLRLNSSKIILCGGSRGMWRPNQAAMFVHRVHCIWLLRSMSLPRKVIPRPGFSNVYLVAGWRVIRIERACVPIKFSAISLLVHQHTFQAHQSC